MKKHVVILRTAILLGVTAVLAQAAPPTVASLLAQAQNDIEASTHRNDPKTLEQAKLSIDKALLLEPKNPWAWYSKAYAAYGDFILGSVKHDTVASEAALNEADQDLEKSISINPTADALALDVSVIGGLIRARGGDSAMQLGPRIGEAMARARELGPENPRVLMIAGISALYTPPQWGGDVHEALKLLEHSVAAFEKERPVAPEPSWGAADVHVWLGQAHQKLGDTAKAKGEFEKALALDPNYAWVKYVLLPGIDKSAK